MFISAGKMETFAFAKAIGVGNIHAAINLTQLVLQENPQFLIFIGSAGSYDPHEKLLSIIEAQIASQIELSMFEGKSYTPIDNVIEAYFNEDINSQDQNILNVSRETSPTIVNSSHYITTHEASTPYFLKHNIRYENMEFYAVLSVAKTFMIPVKGIFCITNYANPNAHQDFLQYSAAANQRLEEYVRTHYAQYL